jgi:hypothetical protein
MQALIDNEDTPMNEREFVAFLEEQQILQPPTDCSRFIEALKAYVKDQGCTLITRDTSTTFTIKEQTAEERVTVSNQLLQLMASTMPLENWIFEDETSIEESPHPKGEAPVGRPGACVWLCVQLWCSKMHQHTVAYHSTLCNGTQTAAGCCRRRT